MSRNRILVIDDNPISLRLAELALQLGGFNVQTALDAASALKSLGDWIPDVILVDLRMPGTDGVGFVRALRSMPEIPLIPVIAMSAYDPPPRAQIEQLGFSGFIGKPMSPSEFCRQLQGFLGEAPASGTRTASLS